MAAKNECPVGLLTMCAFCLKAREQTWQTKGFSPVWILRCCLKLNRLELMRRPHTGQHLSSDLIEKDVATWLPTQKGPGLIPGSGSGINHSGSATLIKKAKMERNSFGFGKFILCSGWIIVSTYQWSFMWMLKLSRLWRTELHLIQSMGHRSFWIWCSYSLTWVLLLLLLLLLLLPLLLLLLLLFMFMESEVVWCGEGVDLWTGGERGDLRASAALVRCSSVSLATAAPPSWWWWWTRGTRMAAISDFFLCRREEREKGRLKSWKG